jgi:hypothetical protein
MQLLYRGVAYTLNAQSAELTPESPSPARLIYRGSTYLASNPTQATATPKAHATLVYRGQPYSTAQAPISQPQPRTRRLSWKLNSQL